MGREDEEVIEDDVENNLEAGDDHRGFGVADSSERPGEGLDDEAGGKHEGDDGEVLEHEFGGSGSVGGDDELGCGVAEWDGESSEEKSKEDGEPEAFSVGFAVFVGVVFAKGSADHGGGGDSDGHAEADQEPEGGGGGSDGGESISAEVLDKVAVEEGVYGLEGVEGDGGPGEYPDSGEGVFVFGDWFGVVRHSVLSLRGLGFFEL